MSETDINYLKLLEERAQKAQQDHQEALKLMNLSIINLHAAQQSLEDFKGYIEYKKSSQQKEGQDSTTKEETMSKQPTKIRYRLVSDNDSNVFIDLESETLDSASLEALEVLGYSIVEVLEPVDNDEPNQV